MILYQIQNSEDITNEEDVGEEINILHRTYQGAEFALENLEADWDDDWGVPPVLEVTEQEFDSIDDAIADGWMIRK